MRGVGGGKDGDVILRCLLICEDPGVARFAVDTDMADLCAGAAIVVFDEHAAHALVAKDVLYVEVELNLN